MLKPAYKVRHWFPSEYIPIACDGWGNTTEYIHISKYYENKGLEDELQAPFDI